MAKQTEHQIQVGCVNWFRYQYPNFALLLRAIPNGGLRNAITGKMLKDEGVIAGTPDLILFIARGGYHGLFIEMKTPKGTQSDSQKEFENLTNEQGYKYVICRSLLEFICVINSYLK